MPIHAVKDDQTLTLSLEGNLTSTTIVKLKAECTSKMAAAGSFTHLVADISHVNMIDSMGLNFLISLLSDAQAAGRTLKITGASPMNQRLFAMVNLGERVTLG